MLSLQASLHFAYSHAKLISFNLIILEDISLYFKFLGGSLLHRFILRTQKKKKMKVCAKYFAFQKWFSFFFCFHFKLYPYTSVTFWNHYGFLSVKRKYFFIHVLNNVSNKQVEKNEQMKHVLEICDYYFVFFLGEIIMIDRLRI